MATVAARLDQVHGTGWRRGRTFALVAVVAAASWGAGFGSAKLGARTTFPEIPLVTVGHTAHVPAGVEPSGIARPDPTRPHGHAGGQVKAG
jgi:hypothetical protein